MKLRFQSLRFHERPPCDEHRSWLKQLILAMACLFLVDLSNAFAQNPSQDLGSTMTLEELQRRPAKAQDGSPKVEEESTVWTTSAADAPTPSLKIRFYPSPYQLTPSKASVHFGRALLTYQTIPEVYRKEWNELELSWDDAKPNYEGIAKHIGPFKEVLDELKSLARCEDNQWDLRIRDRVGPDAYSFLLPEIQSARHLNRVLYYQTRLHLHKREFNEAFENIQIGFRLSEMIGTGETLVQQLVASAIESMMQELILHAIATEGCPNLYWAMATVPQPLGNFRKSILTELDGIERMFPVLRDAENDDLDAAAWDLTWKKTIQQVQELEKNFGMRNRLSISIPLTVLSGTREAKGRLVKAGYDPQKLSAMPNERIVALDALLELRSISNEMLKVALVPKTTRPSWLQEQGTRAESLLAEGQETPSLGKSIAQLLLPAVLSAEMAQQRSMMMHARLMTLEAIRIHAAQNNGQLPSTLDELKAAPSVPDPFTHHDFLYSVSDQGTYQEVTLTAQVPDQLSYARELKVRFKK